jgi:membrane-associated phospholipid phosphatase
VSGVQFPPSPLFLTAVAPEVLAFLYFKKCRLKILPLLAGASFLTFHTLCAQDSIHSAPRETKVVRSLIAPAVLVAAGLISIEGKYAVRDKRNENFPHFHTRADDYLQYAPVAVVYGLNASGIEGKNDLVNRTVLLIKSELLMTVLVQSLKYGSHVQRPDNSDFHSFPSGHTAQAFAAATFLQKEYGHLSVWYSIGGYAVASGVGALRILNNRHWLPDVLVGAGIGILSANLVYLTHQYRWGKKKKTQAFILPTYGNGPGFYFCLRLK